MSKLLNEQIVLVTGAGRGLGSAIAHAFIREGAKVAINYRHSQASAEALANQFGKQAIAVQGDVRDSESVATMLEVIHSKLGKPTTLIHNALADYSFNGDARDTLNTLTEEALNQQLQTAVVGALNMIQALKPEMENQGFGRIITIGTNLFQNPVVPYHDYTAAKAALLSLTRTAAAELGSKGITANMVSCGLLKTTDASSATPEAVFELIAQSTPLRSVTTPEEAADAVLFFASPWARAVTGQNLIVDGGLVYG